MRRLRSTEEVLRRLCPPTLQVGSARLHNRKPLNPHIHSWSAVDGLATQERLAHARKRNALHEETSEERSKTAVACLSRLLLHGAAGAQILIFLTEKVVVLPCVHSIHAGLQQSAVAGACHTQQHAEYEFPTPSAGCGERGEAEESGDRRKIYGKAEDTSGKIQNRVGSSTTDLQGSRLPVWVSSS